MEYLGQKSGENWIQNVDHGNGSHSSWSSTTFYRVQRNDEQLIYGFMNTGGIEESNKKGYYKLIQVRKIKDVKLTEVEGIIVSKVNGINKDKWTIKNPFGNYKALQGIELTGD